MMSEDERKRRRTRSDGRSREERIGRGDGERIRSRNDEKMRSREREEDPRRENNPQRADDSRAADRRSQDDKIRMYSKSKEDSKTRQGGRRGEDGKAVGEDKRRSSHREYARGREGEVEKEYCIKRRDENSWNQGEGREGYHHMESRERKHRNDDKRYEEKRSNESVQNKSWQHVRKSNGRKSESRDRSRSGGRGREGERKVRMSKDERRVRRYDEKRYAVEGRRSRERRQSGSLESANRDSEGLHRSRSDNNGKRDEMKRTNQNKVGTEKEDRDRKSKDARDRDSKQEKRRMSRERERKEGNAYQSESRKKRKLEGRSQSRSLSPESKAKEKEILERGLIMKEETKKLKEILDLKTQQEAKEAEEEEERRRKMEADLVVVTPKKRNSTESLRHNPSHVSQYKNSLSEKVGDDSEEESDDDIEILRRGGSARVLAPSIGVKALPPSMMVSSENKRTNLDEAEQTKAKVPEPLYAKEDFEPEPRGLGSKPAQKQEQKKARVSNSHQPQQLPPTPSDPKVISIDWTLILESNNAMNGIFQATILSCGVCQTDALNIYVDDEHFTEPSHQVHSR